MEGYFREDRFFVHRQKHGEPGYLVFAPFITSIKSKRTAKPYENGIMVSLGWVPSENAKEITKNAEPIPSLPAPEEEYHPIPNDYT